MKIMGCFSLWIGLLCWHPAAYGLSAETAHRALGLREPQSDDIYQEIRRVLISIQQRIETKEASIRNEVTRWTAFESFKQELYFIFASDPTVLIQSPEIPETARSSSLTTSLQRAFDTLALEASLIEGLLDAESWKAFQRQMEEIFELRSSQRYQQARLKMKTGELPKVLLKVQSTAEDLLRAHSLKEVRVHFIDPSLSKLQDTLSQLQQSLSNDSGLKTRSVASILGPKDTGDLSFQQEVWLVALMVFSVGVLLLWLLPVPARKPMQTKEDTFSYPTWIEEYQGKLKAMQQEAQQFRQVWMAAKEKLTELQEAQVGLQLAKNRAQYEKALKRLQSAAPQLKDLLEGSSVYQLSDAQSSVFSTFLKLCDAIEHKRLIDIDAKPHPQPPPVSP